ncbi:MAG: M28 family metallopeptidase [Chloroflexota bacterium]|nr:M28 family metallopeptidase [Chloroflexota bacterium]
MISKTIRMLIVLTMFAAVFGFAPTVLAGPASCDTRVNNTHAKLLECVTLEGVREHQAAFQEIADDNGGTRASGTPGYDESVDYVVERMTAAGYNVTLHNFSHLFVPPPVVQQLAPITASYIANPAVGTGYGTVTAAVTPVDINLTPPRANSSGCETADFASFPAGNIALIQRGTCSFAIKALNAQAAGASAVILFNQGDTAAQDRNNTLNPTLGGPNVANIPVVGISFADGAALAAPGSQATVSIQQPQTITVQNVLAESKRGDPNNVVMAGAHLDSVFRGPGINDNGSGSAALIEVAEQMAKVNPRNKVRFAWWGAEESGLVGSIAYVNSLSQAERDKIALYLNFDMVGSPNHVFFIYDGDDSDGVGAGPGPAGSAEIEETFEAFFNMVGEPFKGTDFSGRSDYGPFIAAGIPSGGLFTGAEGIKTDEEAAIWGGTAGEQYDPCYHIACDTYANNNDHALAVNSDAIAFAVLQYAMSTADINGARGKGNFPPVSGGGAIPGTSSQSGLHDHDHEPDAE